MLSPKNIKNSPLTTILGAILILAAVFSVLVFKNAWTEAGIAISAGITLLFASDPRGGSGTTVCVGIMFLFVFSSCRHSKSTVSSVNHQKTDSTVINSSVQFRDTSIVKVADTLSLKFDVTPDSLGMVNFKPVVYETKTTKAKVSIINNALQVDCICKELELKFKIASYQNSVYKSLLDKRNEVKSTVKVINKVPTWCWILLLLNVVILGIYLLKKQVQW